MNDFSKPWKQLRCISALRDTRAERFPNLGNFSGIFSKHWKNPASPDSVGSKVWKNGLTLIEVLLAIVILGIGSGTLMLATARCISVVAKARHYSNAQRLIPRVGAENPLTRGEIDEGTDSGKFKEGYTWEREVTEFDDENREGLYTVRTRVSWSTRGKERFEEVTTWHYIEPEDDR